jgi:protein-S-isoprenylcysteine O-methyltransferase Ste14
MRWLPRCRSQHLRDVFAVALFALLLAQALVDETARPGLVTSGVYALSRNPIFLALLAGGYLGARLQIAAEEAYLVRTYGDPYRAYARRVGRLVPGIGKLA